MKKIYQIKHSQNFLKNPKTIQTLIGQMHLNPEDVVIEIGPGTGQLTRHILPKVKCLIAVEKDANLSRKLLGKYPNLICTNADFLDYALPVSDFKVVGNIPFAHTAEILRKLVKHQSPPIESYLIMQKEAAEKFTGDPLETKQSLLLKPIFDIEVLADIPKYEFIPVPKVNAVLCKISKRPDAILNIKDYDSYCSFIEEVFTGFYPNVFTLLKKKYGFNKAKYIQKELKKPLLLPRGGVTFEDYLKIWQLV